jgi:hypothetical protein
MTEAKQTSSAPAAQAAALQARPTAAWPVEAPPVAVAGPNRRRAAVQAACMLVIAALLAWRWPHPLPIAILTTMAVLSLAGALGVPGILRVLERFASLLAHGIGSALTLILLVPFYYLCFPAGRLILALSRQDPLRRTKAAPGASYWIDHPASRGPEAMRRPF